MRSRAVILSQVGFWLAACLVLTFLLWLFHAVLMPFVVALVLGYLLDPLVGRIERLRLGRGGATTVILVGSLVAVIVAVALFSPMLVRQVAGFIKALPDLVKRVQDLAATAGDQLNHGRIGELLAKYGLGGSVADLRSGAGDLRQQGRGLGRRVRQQPAVADRSAARPSFLWRSSRRWSPSTSCSTGHACWGRSSR